MSLFSRSTTTQNLFQSVKGKRFNTGIVFGIIIISALIAFEAFNYSTTEYALRDILGELRFAGLPWATILSLAFCGIDFAGIARLFTPEQGLEEPKEVWYLFGAWLLAATMNALLTWWGVSMAIAGHVAKSASIVDATMLTRVVPVFVAVMVWVIRILIIGSLSMAGDRLLSGNKRSSSFQRRPSTASPSIPSPAPSIASRPVASMTSRPLTPRPNVAAEPSMGRPEPSYHSLSMNARPPAASIHTEKPQNGLR